MLPAFTGGWPSCSAGGSTDSAAGKLRLMPVCRPGESSRPRTGCSRIWRGPAGFTLTAIILRCKNCCAMKILPVLFAFMLAAWPGPSFGGIKVAVDRNGNNDANEDFIFKNLLSPSGKDAAAKAVFTIVNGKRDGNGGDLGVLNDDRLPDEADQPSANFFFQPAKDGGRLVADLGVVIDVRQINTYSWHPGARGPQVYRVYGSDGRAAGFNAKPGRGIDPEKCGWRFIAGVDTRAKGEKPGGQYGVNISNPGGIVGSYRYLLFGVSRTDGTEKFSDTFFSEIDVVDGNAPAPAVLKPSASKQGREIVEAEGGRYRIVIDTAEAPDLAEWVHNELMPVVREWYPKLVSMLPGDGYSAPGNVRIVFKKDMKGVAATGGTRISCAAEWYRRNLKGEAIGSIIHEMVHVVQRYGLAKQKNPDAAPTPGWLTEGITDYIRFFLYEPQKNGAGIAKDRISKIHYNDSYRVTANFLDWVVNRYDKNLIARLNAALRDGMYSENLWKQYTGRTAEELEREWKQDLGKK